MRTLNYNHLYYFWTVAREGTIARAAEMLHLMPQTISGQLSEFESRLDTKLFTRCGRRLILSDTGRLVYDYADNIFRLGNELTDVLKRGMQNSGQQLTIGLVNVVSPLVTYRVIQPAFELDNISVNCRSGNIEQLLTELSLHRLDMLLSDSPLNANGNIRAFNHYLGDSSVAFFAAPALAEACRENFPASLDQQPLLLPTMNKPLRRSLEKWFRKLELSPRVCGEFEDSSLQRYMAEAGAGIFAAPTIIKNDLLKRYQVECIGQVDSIRESFYLIASERRLRHPAAVAIYDIARSGLFRSTGRAGKASRAAATDRDAAAA